MLCQIYVYLNTSEKGERKKSLERMTKGFYFGTSVLNTCVSRFLDAFSLSQLAFWSPLLRIFSELLQGNYKLLKLFFYALSLERSK